jgi:hypothetical protein
MDATDAPSATAMSLGVDASSKLPELRGIFCPRRRLTWLMVASNRRF